MLIIPKPPSGRYNTPGELLREKLEERNLTQAEFAKCLGISQPNLNDILKGRRRVSAAFAIKLEKELDLAAELWIELQGLFDLDLEREKMR